MFRLCHELRAVGEDAYVTERQRPVTWDCPVSTAVSAKTIAVYAEAPGGNPLDAQRVVRWVQNYPGWTGGATHYAPWNLVVYWHEDFRAAAEAAAGRDLEGHRLQVGLLEPWLFRPEGGTRKLGYVGKGPRGAQMRLVAPSVGEAVGDPSAWAPLPDVDEWLTRTWPCTREDVAALLRSASDLYCYDTVTMLADEAAACGARVWQPHEGAWRRRAAPPLVAWDDTSDVRRLVGLARERWERPAGKPSLSAAGEPETPLTGLGSCASKVPPRDG